MKKFALLGIATMAVIALLNTKAQAEDGNVEAIMEAHIEALGGVEALDKIKSIQRSGPASLSSEPIGELAGRYETATVVGKKYYEIIDLNGIGEGRTGWNGSEWWHYEEEGGRKEITELPDETLEGTLAGASLSPLVAVWQKKGSKAITVLSEETREGTTYHVLQIAGRDDTRFYLDKESHLLALMTTPSDEPAFPGKDMYVYSSDHTSHEGVQFPGTMSVVVDTVNFTVHFDETKINQVVDDSLFEKPKS